MSNIQISKSSDLSDDSPATQPSLVAATDEAGPTVPMQNGDWSMDPRNPKTWSLGSRVFHTGIPALYCFVA